MPFPSEIGNEPDICNAEMVKCIKTRQHSLTSPRSKLAKVIIMLQLADCRMKVFKARGIRNRKNLKYRAVTSSIIGGGLLFIYSGSAQLIAFEINCFYGL